MPDFLYIAKLADAEELNGEEWEGRIKAMTRSIRRSFESLKTEILSRIRGEVERDADATKTRQQVVTDKIEGVKKEVNETRKEVNEIRKELKEEMNEIKKETNQKLDDIMEFLKS